MVDRARPEGDVDEGVALEDPVALSLGVAAAHGDDRVRVAGLLRLRVAEVCGEPLVGLLADRAGVEDEHVGFLRRCCLAEPELLEQAANALGVVGVHLAPERRNVVAPHGGKCTAGRPVHFWHRRLTAAFVAGSRYFANSMARDSRMTVTLICPGYSRCCSISRAISCDSSAASSSAISSGFTITRTSRPACKA